MSKSLKRCAWVLGEDKLSTDYHDKEWGVPVHDDQKHFEFLILEGAQAGLSWHTILKRRKGYEKAFSMFNPEKVAGYDSSKMIKLMEDEGIIRNRLKIASSVTNAQCFLKIQEEFGSFDRYVWGFVNEKTIQNHRNTLKDIPTETKESQLLSRDLKKRGFRFVGATIMYAYMQAVGLVNDHTVDCFRYCELAHL